MPSKDQKILLFRILYLLLFIFLLIALFSLFKDFRKSINIIRNSNKDFIYLILVFTFLNFVVAAYSYVKLSFFPLRIIKSTIVQIAANTMNRILPAGLGTLGTLYDFLVKSKNTKTQALALVAINNILGLISGVVILLSLTFIGNFSAITNLHLKFINIIYAALILIFIVFTNFLLYKKVKRFNLFLKDLLKQLITFKDRKSNLALAFAAQLLLNVSNYYIELKV